MKFNSKEFAEFIRTEALKINQEMINEEKGFSVAGEPTTIKMNKNDKVGDSNKALVYKDKKGKEEKSGPNKTKSVYEEPAVKEMNSQDNEGGSDKKAAAAVKVDASGKKTGDAATKGMADSKFTTKKEGPKTSASEPFEEKFDGKMNTQDGVYDEETKTYVDAGAEKGGNTVVAGQATAKIHEKAPVVKDKAPIATGIEIKGSNVKPKEVDKSATDATTDAAKALKESYTKSELINFIKEEALKVVKKEKLMEELKATEEELKKLNSEE